MRFNPRTKEEPLIWIDGAHRSGTFINAATIFTMLLLTSVMGRTVCLAAEPNAHHDLSVELNLQEKLLRAVDEIAIANSPVDRLDFNLTRRADNLGVAVNGRPRKVDFEDGRLCVGADYLYQEKKSEEDARRYRMQILRNYSTLVPPDKDFALERFHSRYDPISKAIGYDKGAMVFPMLRKQLGEEAFWGALRNLYRNRLFKATFWTDLQKASENRGKGLWPFEQSPLEYRWSDGDKKFFGGLTGKTDRCDAIDEI